MVTTVVVVTKVMMGHLKILVVLVVLLGHANVGVCRCGYMVVIGF